MEQSGELMARIERSGRDAEERVRAARAEAERELAAVTSSTRQVEVRMHRLLDTGGSLSELMEQVTAAAERARAAEERAIVAERRVLEFERSLPR